MMPMAGPMVWLTLNCDRCVCCVLAKATNYKTYKNCCLWQKGDCSIRSSLFCCWFVFSCFSVVSCAFCWHITLAKSTRMKRTTVVFLVWRIKRERISRMHWAKKESRQIHWAGFLRWWTLIKNIFTHTPRRAAYSIDGSCIDIQNVSALRATGDSLNATTLRLRIYWPQQMR